MMYMIELRYFYGWDNAEWTVADDDGERPLRFADRSAAQTALDEFFAAVKSAVSEGNMDSEASPADYRIVETIN
jgi:hypothetical protein